MRLTIYFLLFTLLPTLALANDFNIPERRKLQHETNEGYAIFPFPYSLPGIGEGLSLVGGATNLGGGYTDLYGLIIGGGIKGAAIGVDDLHLIPRKLILEAGVSAINKATITSYDKRGMKSNKDDYNLIEISNTRSIGSRLTATFYNRRLEFYGAYYLFWSRLERIRNNDGEVIIDIEDPKTEKGDQKIVGIRIDLTDDYQDPRHGLRIDTSGWYNPSEDSGPEYLLLDINTSLYLPFGKRSTWVFNYFQSDAFIFSKGETDREDIIDKLGIDCDSIADAEDKSRCNRVIDNTIAQNTYGTASSLGGFSRLRAYPQGRYSGAHTRFLGTEFRWNLTDEFTPFNLYVIRDVRTAVQLAFFYEAGSIADVRSDLYDITRSAYGVGVRIVTASGAVFRGDFSYGNEGFQPNVFIGYPWEL